MSALCHKRTFGHSFDDIVSAGEQLRRHGEAERLGRFEVDHEVELVRLHYRQIAGLGAFENAAGIDADLPVAVAVTSTVTYQSPSSRVLTQVVHHWHGMARRLFAVHRAQEGR